MRFVVLLLTSMTVLTLSSCTNGDPSLSVLSSFNGITFSTEKKSTETYTIGTAPTCQSELLVTGQCDQRFEQLQFSIDNETTWTRMTGYNTGSDGDCVDGEFKLYFPNACTTFNISNGGNELKKILIRADKNIAQNSTREASVKFTSDVINATKISIADAGSIVEGTTATFSVTLSSANEKPVTVDYALVPGSAAPSDFSGATVGSISFAAGEVSKTISVNTTDNSVVCEIPKTFSVNLSNPSSNAVITNLIGSANIVDPDRPILSFVDLNSAASGVAEVTESAAMLVTVGLSAACPTQDIKFDWATIDSTATSTSDYAASSGTATIPKGLININLNIPITQDAVAEAQEKFSISLSNPVEATIATSLADVYINDDDLPVASISSASALENASSISFTVTLSSTPASTVTINYTFAHITTANADFTTTPISGMVTILGGFTSASITFPINNDLIDEPDQNFSVTLESAGAIGATISSTNSTGTGTIQDDDAAPSLSISATSATISEGAGTATFVVTPSIVSEKTITVLFSATDDSAIAGEDYTAVSSATVTLPPNTASGSKTVTILDDTIDEPRQFFWGTISSPTNATLGATSTVRQYLTDNDPEPTVSIANGSATEGSNVVLQVALSALSQQTFSIDYTNTLITALSSDFSGFIASGTLNFPASTLTQNITYITDDDAILEGPETFTVVLSNPQNTSSMSDASGNITITNNIATGTISDNEPFAPPVLTLLIPTLTPSISATPTIRASGVAASEDVLIYSDSNCDTQLTSAFASGTTVDIALPTLSAGSHSFYVRRKSGAIYSACSTSGLAYTFSMPVVVPVYPTHGANWNDYISFSNNSNSIYTQADTSCTGNETGPTNQFNGCIHGGEKLKVVATGFTTCTNLYIVENLSVFDWDCDNGSGVATFYTRGIKVGKGLRDLINFSTTAFKQNHIVLGYDGATISSSSSSVWWTNPVSNLSVALNNSATTTVNNLNDPGKIYILPANQDTFGYAITADKVSLVTAPSTRLNKYEPTDSFNCNSSTGQWANSASDDVDTVICAGNRKYLWIEADIFGESGTYQPNYALYATDMKRSQIRNTITRGFSHSSITSAITLYNSHYNLIQGLTIHDAGGGLLLQTSSYNTAIGIYISNTYGPPSTSPTAIEINGASAYFNKLYNIRISNHGKGSTNTAAIEVKAPKNIISKAIITNTLGNNYTYGIRLGGSTASENILSQIITAGSTHSGIIFDGSPSKNVLTNLTIANVQHGIYFFGGSPSENAFSSVVIHNTEYGVYTDTDVPAGPHGNILQDILISKPQYFAFKFQNTDFAISGGYILYDVNIACGSGSGIDFCASDALGVAPLATTDFIGPISVDDVSNPDDSSGGGAYSTLTLEGALKFENWFRGWNKDYSMTSSSAVGASDTALRIWDFNAVTGGRLENRSGLGVSANSAISFSGADCASNAVGATQETTINGISYYRNAIEISGDRKGNDNELCESGEDCFYAPNIGAAQPNGALSSSYCTIETSTHLFQRDP
ncbi:MAG: hypothetical protein B7Y39_02300 [Bdellovibrio sp. 28-41-41]|nr:MAG: hypothetical protein B7Y39_02300 [Bdellovibrio sp. 28-41-41]